ncbi:MAG: hypothetical protein DRH90_03535 [Deltaproteobacteria bacterium]|nr:MAG: hypothetical protein DRH90_03535 [Deltaproteobacteria bacterium]
MLSQKVRKATFCENIYIPSFKTWSFGTVKDPATRESEIFGYADGGSYLNPKHEIRNPKRFDRLTALSKVEGQYRMIQIANDQNKSLEIQV